MLVSTFSNESTLGAALIPPSPNYLQKNRVNKCTQKSAESSAANSTIVIHQDDDTEEDERINPLERENIFWKRFKIIFGLRSAAYANKNALSLYDCRDLNEVVDTQFTWWTKFYNSMWTGRQDGLNKCKHKLIIYNGELEKQPQFSFLQDWAVPVPLVHGVKLKKHAPPKEDVYATLKLQIKLTPCECAKATDAFGDGNILHPLPAALSPREQNLIKSLTDVVKILVRVYIVQALQVRPRDWFSDSDTYVRLTLGGKMVSDHAHYVPNQSNPVFGRFFELSTTLPADPILEVGLFDHDKHKDEIIGYTQIDLEDRWHSKHRATVGIPLEYSRFGYNQWRDTMPPSQLLADLCLQRGIQPPYYYGNVIEVDGMLLGDETVISKCAYLS